MYVRVSHKTMCKQGQRSSGKNIRGPEKSVGKDKDCCQIDSEKN